MTAIKKSQVAEEIPFDNTTSNLISEDVQAAIEELDDKVGVSASPGFTWGRGGNSAAGTWLLNDSVPSNRAGRTVNLVDPVITAISIANEDLNTFTVSFYEHDGDSINLNLLGSINVINARSFDTFTNFPLTQGKQLAVQISAGSSRNTVIGVQLSGTVS